jgi:PAS domain S-box-containing protein
LLGLPVAQIEGQRFLDFVHPDDVPATLEAMEQLSQQKPVIEFVNRYRAADGSYRYIEWRTDPYGNLMYASSRDITERRQMEDALRQSEEKYHLIAENTSDGIFIYDALLGRVTYASPSHDLMYGRAPGETLGREVRDIKETIHPDDRDIVIKQIYATISRKDPDLIYYYRSQHKDGHYFWCEDHTRFNYAPDGKFLSAIIISRNVTERKQAEEKQLALTLENERTGMLTQFIQDASHEFRTPLSIISSGTYLLLRSEQQEMRQRKADHINDQIKRITRLVEMLLMLVKAESDDVLGQQQVDIGSVLQVGCELEKGYGIKKEGNPKKPELRFSPPPELPAVMGDSNLLLEAFKQLLDNAYHFTPPEGTITVTMGTADGQVWVEVDDTGKGIAEENLSQIFDTFWRLDDAHTTAGFGLGLPIAKRIIEHHGGTITVRSQLRQGTQMRVTLPAAP